MKTIKNIFKALCFIILLIISIAFYYAAKGATYMNVKLSQLVYKLQTPYASIENNR